MANIASFSEAVDIISQLRDYPNQEDGLTPTELKAKFDKASILLKEYINDVVVPAINALDDSADETIKKLCAVINDAVTSKNATWSSQKIREVVDAVPDFVCVHYGSNFNAEDVALKGRPVFCLYPDEDLRPRWLNLISVNPDPVEVIFGGCYDNKIITCTYKGDTDWSVNIKTLVPINTSSEVFIGTDETPLAEYVEAFSAGRACFMRIPHNGVQELWTVLSAHSKSVSVYTIRDDASILFGTLWPDGKFTHGTYFLEGIVDTLRTLISKQPLVGDENTPLAEYAAAFSAGRACFRRVGNLTWTANYASPDVAFFYAIFDALGCTEILTGSLLPDGTFVPTVVKLGDIDTALDGIIAIQNTLIRGSTFTLYHTNNIAGEKSTYHYEEGMTWGEWAESEYNTDGFAFDAADELTTTDNKRVYWGAEVEEDIFILAADCVYPNNIIDPNKYFYCLR